LALRDGERDVGAAAATDRAAVGPGGEVTIGEQAHIERGQRERLTAACIGPPQLFGDRDIDRQRGHLDAFAAVHDNL